MSGADELKKLQKISFTFSFQLKGKSQLSK